MVTPLFTNIDQIAFVVNDAVKTVKYMSKEFGIGPFCCLQFGDAGDGNSNFLPIKDCVCENDNIGTYCIKCCVCNMPNGAQIEVISPVRGNSIFERYLRRHGPGVQHISVDLGDDFETTISRMNQAGFYNGQVADVAYKETCSFVEHLSVLGTYIEFHKRRPQDHPCPVKYNYVPGPGENDLPEISPVFTQIDQINIQIDDLDKALNVLDDQYGICPWEISESSDGRVANCKSMNVTLSLLESVNRSSIVGANQEAEIISLSAKKVGDIPKNVPVTKFDDCVMTNTKDIIGVNFMLY